MCVLISLPLALVVRPWWAGLEERLVLGVEWSASRICSYRMVLWSSQTNGPRLEESCNDSGPNIGHRGSSFRIYSESWSSGSIKLGLNSRMFAHCVWRVKYLPTSLIPSLLSLPQCDLHHPGNDKVYSLIRPLTL